jgi:hypothetical protein
MDFVKYDELDVTNQISAFVQHTSQNFRCHDQTIGLRIDLYVASQDTHRIRRKSLLEIPELLI